MALSNIAGIGGGGVAVPLLIGFFHLNTKPAIAISSFNIAITTMTRFILNFHRKHPEKPNVAVVDYNIATIMMPTCLAGAQIGAFMLVTFPALIIQILLTLTVAALTLQTYQRALIITEEENKKLAEKHEPLKHAESLDRSEAASYRINGSPEANSRLIEMTPIQGYQENQLADEEVEIPSPIDRPNR